MTPCKTNGSARHIPDPLYPCRYCAEEYSWPATDLWWSERDQDWVCEMCWDEHDRDLVVDARGEYVREERGPSLADEIKAQNVNAVVRRLLEYSSVEYGWHGNPDNHTLKVTLYFGSRDPRHLVKKDAYGHAPLTMDVLEFLANVPDERRSPLDPIVGKEYSE